MRGWTVITGGAGGMGLATAKLVGREGPVLLSDVNEQAGRQAVAQLGELGVTAEWMRCDISDAAHVQALTARARELGPVASVVHTAGLSPTMASAERIMRVNALGTLLVTEAAYQLAGSGFSLVNTASMAGHMAPRLLVPTRSYKRAREDGERFLRAMMIPCRLVPGKLSPALAYVLSKHFTIWYSRAQSKRFGQKGARILSVSPGSIDTPMGRLEEAGGAGAILQFASLERFGTVEEIAELLAFCSSARAGYLTGTDILCDGGVMANFKLTRSSRVVLNHEAAAPTPS